MSNRREFLKLLGAGAARVALAGIPVGGCAAAAPREYPSRRPPPARRKFVSAAVEREIARIKPKIGDPKLAWLFENCYPNTLDTTVHTGTLVGKPDTFIVTGDIDARWLRDWSAQGW